MDQANVITSATEARLQELLVMHEDSTSNQIAILTIPSLKGDVLEEFSLRVARTWELGTAANDNGVLVLIAIQDRKMRIEVGNGLEGTLTDAYASRIIRNEFTPYFRDGDYDTGILVGTQRIVETMEGTYTPSDVDGEAPPVWFGLIFLIIPSIFGFFGMFSTGCMKWFLFLFLVPFFAVGSFVLFGSVTGMVIFLALYAILFISAQFHPKVQEAQQQLKDGKSAKIWGITVTPGSSGGGSGGGWSSGSSFSGGGGSFSGGGASGGW